MPSSESLVCLSPARLDHYRKELLPKPISVQFIKDGYAYNIKTGKRTPLNSMDEHLPTYTRMTRKLANQIGKELGLEVKIRS